MIGGTTEAEASYRPAEELYSRAIETLTSQERGMWVSADMPFQVEEREPTGFGGSLVVEPARYPLEISLKELADLATYQLQEGLFSTRSRLQQAGINFQVLDGAILKDGAVRIPMRATSASRRPIANVPDTFHALRFFVENQPARLKGEDLSKLLSLSMPAFDEFRDPFAASSYIYPSSRDEVTDQTNEFQLTFASHNVHVITAPEIDVTRIIQAPTRTDLHNVLQLRRTNIDDSNLGLGDFYLSATRPVQVPSGYILKISTRPKFEWSLDHEQSPLIDQGFKGRIMLELIKSGKEEEAESGKTNRISFFAYRLAQ